MRCLSANCQLKANTALKQGAARDYTPYMDNHCLCKNGSVCRAAPGFARVCYIDYVSEIKNFLNSEGHQNSINESTVTAILLKGLILPIGGVSAVEGLRSTGLTRIVLKTTGIPSVDWLPDTEGLI